MNGRKFGKPIGIDAHYDIMSRVGIHLYHVVEEELSRAVYVVSWRLIINKVRNFNKRDLFTNLP